MNQQQLMNAVQATLAAAFPEEPIYTDGLPEDFARPSFALELQREQSADLNLAMVRKTAAVRITGYVPEDSREELSRRQEKVMELFAGPALRVGDRYPAVSANKGKGMPEFCTVRVTFSWSDARPGYHDPDDMSDPVSAAVPKIENYERNIHNER